MYSRGVFAHSCFQLQRFCGGLKHNYPLQRGGNSSEYIQFTSPTLRPKSNSMSMVIVQEMSMDERLTFFAEARYS